MKSTGQSLTIRDANSAELPGLGRLLVDAYRSLPGFPGPDEEPHYFEMLANVGLFVEKPGATVLVALSERGDLVGGVVYFGDMAQYGTPGTAPGEKHASGIRLLGVDPAFRGFGAGWALTLACIERARQCGHAQVILHTTKKMQLAWDMYERIGFVRSEDLDFFAKDLHVCGFRLALHDAVVSV